MNFGICKTKLLIQSASESLCFQSAMLNVVPLVASADEQQHKEKEKINDDDHLSGGSSPEPNSNEVIIPILKKNGPILQSQ